jgi:hypothetical protein
MIIILRIQKCIAFYMDLGSFESSECESELRVVSLNKNFRILQGGYIHRHPLPRQRCALLLDVEDLKNGF